MTEPQVSSTSRDFIQPFATTTATIWDYRYIYQQKNFHYHTGRTDKTKKNHKNKIKIKEKYAWKDSRHTHQALKYTHKKKTAE